MASFVRLRGTRVEMVPRIFVALLNPCMTHLHDVIETLFYIIPVCEPRDDS